MALIRNIFINEEEIKGCYTRVVVDNDNIVKLYTYRNKEERIKENPLLIEYFENLSSEKEISELYLDIKEIQYFNSLKDC